MSVDMNIIVVFINDAATTEIYTLSLHDALPILEKYTPFLITHNYTNYFARWKYVKDYEVNPASQSQATYQTQMWLDKDRKSTRLNSSHANISYAVFCLKKKKHTSYIHSLTSLFF